MFEAFVLFSALMSAAIAALTGFGIGSIMTPVINLKLELSIAVAVVSLPHFIATAERFWHLRSQVDRSVLVTFGLMSAAGGLAGAFLNTRFSSPFLTIIFGCLLVFSGSTRTFGFADRMRFKGYLAHFAGFLSGLFGGLVGNQGGIRAAALLTFGLSSEAFVATSTGIGLIVDLARMPVYLASEWNAIWSQWRIIGLSVVGVSVGTFLGMRVLNRLPQKTFEKIVSFLILLLGIVMLYKGVADLRFGR